MIIRLVFRSLSWLLEGRFRRWASWSQCAAGSKLAGDSTDDEQAPAQ